MYRVLGTCSRMLMSSYSSSGNIHLKAIRPVANVHKATQNQLSKDKQLNRQVPTSSARKVDVKKLFAQNESNETTTPANPRRPNQTKSSLLTEALRVAPTSSTKIRYESEIGNINDFEAEEQRRIETRQSQGKTVKRTYQSKRAKLENKISMIEKFQTSENPLTENLLEKKSKLDQVDESNLRKPKQPKKERSLTQSSDDLSRLDESGRDPPVSALLSTIKEANSVEDLMKLFDKYVTPTEFALGLQKMCQLASMETSDASRIYAQLSQTRIRMEALLISFLNKLSDHEVVTAVTFIMKYYPEDNDFTDKFSISLANRLRRISVHQIVRILEELKSSRHTTQWVHRIYNRLLALAEGRYFEFDNIRDILSLTHKLSYNDRLINRLDERILEISDTLTFDDWFKILVNKSMLKRRDRTIIRAACYHLLKLSESFLFPMEKLKDCLLACAMLNVYEKSFLERLTRDAFEQINTLKDPFILQSIITSMGTLRLRHCELLDAFGRLFVEQPELLSDSNSKILPSFIRTCASVYYSPTSLSKLVENHLAIDKNSIDENSPLNEAKNRIDLVWSLAILDQANQYHISSVLNQEIFQIIQNEISNSKIASALKLLAIYSYSLQKFSKKFLRPTFNIEQIAQQLTLKDSNAQDQLAKSVVTFAAENKYSKFNVVTSNMIVIDCLMVVDKVGTPLDLSTILLSGDNLGSGGQAAFNKIRVEDNNFKIAIKCLDYQDKTLLTKSLSGSVALQLRLLSCLGYKCIPIHYDEFMKIQVPNDRSKYIQRKIKETISASSACDFHVDLSANYKNTESN